jgi:hypothetical protein
MKKLLFVLCTGFTSIAILNNDVYSQNAERPDAFLNTKSFKSTIRHLAAWQSKTMSDMYVPDEKNKNLRAQKDFQDRFKNVDNAQWFYDSKFGFVTYFLQDGYGNRVFYDKKGNWMYSLIFYGEGKLSRDIRAQIKSIYFDFNITLVEEIQMKEGFKYVVYLEDKSDIKVLEVNGEGGIQILQELAKG